MTKTIILIPPPTKGERKQVEREALEEEEDGEEEIVRVLLGLVVREEAVVDSNIRLWNTTVDAVAVAVATAIDGCVGRGCGREKRVKQNKDTEVKWIVVGFRIFECFMGRILGSEAQTQKPNYFYKITFFFENETDFV